MKGIEEATTQIKDLDTKIAHARQAVMWAKESNMRSSKIKPEWVACMLFLILMIDMMRMMFSKTMKMSPVSFILMGVIILAYAVYLLSIYIPNRRERQLSEKAFKEKNAILESLIFERKKLFEDFVALNGGKSFRCISREHDIAIWKEGEDLIFASLINGLIIETEKIYTVTYIATDSLLQNYNQQIGDYKITACKANTNEEKINYSYIFFTNGKSYIFANECYEYLKTLLPDKELADIISKNKQG